MTGFFFHEKAVANCFLISRVTCRMCDSGKVTIKAPLHQTSLSHTQVLTVVHRGSTVRAKPPIRDQRDRGRGFQIR